jgi:hypothetical protein
MSPILSSGWNLTVNDTCIEIPTPAQDKEVLNLNYPKTHSCSTVQRPTSEELKIKQYTEAGVEGLNSSGIQGLIL